jgi:hypothetical protein
MDVILWKPATMQLPVTHCMLRFVGTVVQYDSATGSWSAAGPQDFTIMFEV